jgi:hypothetical protein
MFVAGAIFAVGYGVLELLKGGSSETGFTVAWITLGIAAVAEGASWLRALRQTRREADAASKSLWRYTRASRDPNVTVPDMTEVFLDATPPRRAAATAA